MTTAFALGQIVGPLLASTWFSWRGSFDGALVLTSGALLASTLLLRGKPG